MVKNDKKDNGIPRRGMKNLILLILLILVLAGVPFLLLTYQAGHSGLSRSQVISGLLGRSKNMTAVTEPAASELKGEKVSFLVSVPIGQTFKDPPQISHIAVADLDKDGLLDVIVCDARENTVSWIRQYPSGTYNETVLAKDLIAPAHVQVIDFDKDGDNDILVAVLGMLFPNNDKIGAVVILENDGNNNFIKHTAIEKIARVSDVRGGDLDGDGDMDLAVAQFGYDDGETRWLENLGSWKFKSHILQNLSGPINVELLDIDNDNDLDIISVVSQEWEEIYCFVNDGKENFRPNLLYKSSNEDFGSSGIFISDFDKDGDSDILYTNGDAFDYIPPQPRPWHGVQWLENKGNLKFEFHRIYNFAGAYNARPVDIDHDGDLDLFLISGFNFWDKPGSQSFIWLENTGKMQFREHDIADSPTHLLTLEPGDLNNDGETDFVTGGMHTYPPYDRMGRITIWMNNGSLPGRK
jgi:hypothetical protein